MTTNTKPSINHGLLLQAVPGVSGYQGRASIDGPLEVIHPNTLPLSKIMYHQIGSISQRLWFPRDGETKYSNISWAVNACADADEYELALENFAAAFEQIKIPVLNHPAHVLASRCDKLHQTLNGIPGLSVPKSVRFKPRTPEDFQNTFTSEEFEYPVDVHMPASNDSKHRVSIESDTDWDRIFALPWGGQNVYMTQSLNYSVNDGQQVTASFSVTPFGAKLGSVNAPLSVETERFYEKRLAKSGRVQQIAKDIQSRLPLDIFGIELGLQNDEFVLLSLSAAMAFEMPVGGSPSQRLQLKKRFREIERDIWKTLKYVTKVPFKIQLSL